jgi:Zn-dependent peptidase ImmA (M78 family)
MSDLPASEHTHHLSQIEPSTMSAATVRGHGRVGIWLNDSHAPERQRSNLAHEIGHVVLDHEDAPPLNEVGCRDFHADMEAEADYFGSVLLVPEVAAVAVVRAATPVSQAAEHFGVSEQMMQWRINDSGALVRTRRERGRTDGRRQHEHE